MWMYDILIRVPVRVRVRKGPRLPRSSYGFFFLLLSTTFSNTLYITSLNRL